MELPRGFRRLWAGQSISFFGSEIGHVAFPLTAVLLLEADAVQMGWLTAAGKLPMALFGLLAGVWIDRIRRRPVLVATDFVQGVLALSIPIAAWMDILTLTHLFLVAFGAGTCSVLSAVADRAYLPTLLTRKQLVAGNTRIWFSMSLARSTGPGLAGLLVAWLTAPIAILLDAISFFVAGGLIASIRHDEPQPKPGAHAGTWDGIREGWRRVWNDGLLRPLVLCGATHNICSTAIYALYVLYLTKNLAIGPAMLGVILAAGGVGAVAGSAISARWARRFGIGPTLIFTQFGTGIARLLIPAAGGSTLFIVTLLLCSEFVLGAMRAMFNVTQISLRQTVTPDAYQGRVNATIGFLLWSITPLGALAGGGLAAAIGIRATLWIAAAGVMGSTLWAFFSPLRFTRVVASAESPQDTEPETE